MNLDIGIDQALYVEATSGSDPVLGLESSDVTLKYAASDDDALITYETPSSGWVELGEGMYHANFGKDAIGNTAGTFVYIAKPSGATYFEAYRNAVALSEPAPSEVFASAAYDEDSSTLAVQVWLHKNGELVADPDTAFVTIYAAGVIGNKLLEKAALTPDANGVFVIEEPVTLAANTNYFVKARVTRDSVDYNSGECFISVD